MGDKAVDVIIVVVEPTPKSIEVGTRAAGLAREKGLGRVIVVASRIRGDEDLATVRKAFPDDEIVAVPDDPAIVDADRNGQAPLDVAPDAPAVKVLISLADLVLPSGD